MTTFFKISTRREHDVVITPHVWKEQDPSNEIMLKGLNFIPIFISHTIWLVCFFGGGGASVTHCLIKWKLG